MADEKMPDRDAVADAQAERFDRYVDALLTGGRPSPDDVSDRDEAEMARLAAELAASADPESRPDPAFLDQLRLRMRQADQGIAAVREPLPIRPGVGRARISRRQLFQAGLFGAAGVAAVRWGRRSCVERRPRARPGRAAWG